MITWIQTFIQKNNKWLFSLLLVIIIVSFVFVIGNTGVGPSGIGPRPKAPDFFGYNMGPNSADLQYLRRNTEISVSMLGRRPAAQSMQEAILQRAALLYQARQMNIPPATDEALGEFIRNEVPAFQNVQTGAFDPERYSATVDRFRTNPAIGGEARLIEVLEEDYIIEQVEKALGGPGYVLIEQAVKAAEQQNSVWDFYVVRVSQMGFNPDIKPSEETLRQYYEANREQYQTPRKAEVGYVEFDPQAMTNEVTAPTDEELTAYYEENLAQWPTTDEGTTQPLAEIREEVLQSYREEKAEARALDAATKLVTELYNAEANEPFVMGSGEITSLLKSRELEVKELPAYDPANPPRGLALPQRTLRLAQSLSENNLYSDAARTADGKAVVLFLKGFQPATIPPLEEVRNDVIRDYTRRERSRLFAEHAEDLRDQLEEKLNEGTFIKQAASELGMQAREITDFSISNFDPQMRLSQQLRQTLVGMEEGDISEPIMQGPSAEILFIVDKKTPELTVESPEVEQIMDTYQESVSRITTTMALNDLVTSEKRRIEDQSGGDQSETES